MINDLTSNFRLADLFDIAVISVFLYFTMIWLKQRATRSVAIGLALIALLYGLAAVMDMYLTATLFQVGLTAILIVLVLIFQEDIRRMFERIAAWEIFRREPAVSVVSRSVDTLVESVSLLAGKKTGALLVIKGRESLERHIHGGVLLNGEISIALICSIFQPHSPGHDGALLIEGGRIQKFAVHLPLSKNLEEIRGAGMRHTAALGMAERCDAIVIVVSEERGAISIAEGSKLETIDSPADLKHRLESFYQQIMPKRPEIKPKLRPSRNFRLKVASVAMASLLWLMFAFRVETVHRTFVVPIEYRNLPANWAIAELKPSSVQVTLSGLERVFNFDPGRLLISLDLSNVGEESQNIFINEENLIRPSGLTVSQIQPSAVKIHAYQSPPTPSAPR